MTSEGISVSSFFPSITYDEDAYGFWIQQKGYPRFFMNEGYLQDLMTALTEPESGSVGVISSFRVTEDLGSLILEHFSKGSLVKLLHLGKATAKQWAMQVDVEYGTLIHSYTHTLKSGRLT